jgi:hypothetical protein
MHASMRIKAIIVPYEGFRMHVSTLSPPSLSSIQDAGEKNDNKKAYIFAVTGLGNQIFFAGVSSLQARQESRQ